MRLARFMRAQAGADNRALPGLAAACALKMAGHDVVGVVEKSDGTFQVRSSCILRVGCS